MYYSVLHKTRFHYSHLISESHMQVMMRPLTEGHQQCLSFSLTLQPNVPVFQYLDSYGNWLSHFDIPQFHSYLMITAESTLKLDPIDPLPDALPMRAWEALDADIQAGDFYEMLLPSYFANPTPLLRDLAHELGFVKRRDDPLTLLRRINSALYESFQYAPYTTQVDSPIDHALEERQGVCQDFSHIMAALVRGLKMPCRYVSGYLMPSQTHDDRSPEFASHAWVEVYLPDLGWVGFDPTNNLIVGERHIRVAVGRDYADVPPTKGMFKGEATTELSVGVQVKLMDNLPFDEDLLPIESWSDGDIQELQQQEMLQFQQQQQQQ